MQTTLARHGKQPTRLTRWQIEQVTAAQTPRITFRSPSFYLYKDDPKHRAIVTVYLTLVNDIPDTDKINAVITHHRTERHYNHISFSSLRRLSALSTTPLLSADTFAKIEAALVADEMLAAGQEQADRKPELKTRSGYRLIDRVDAAIAYGQVEEMVNERHETEAQP
jgi:hypothetical protein